MGYWGVLGAHSCPEAGLGITFTRSGNNIIQVHHSANCRELTKATWVKSDLINSFYKKRSISIPTSIFRIKNQQHKTIFSNQ